MVFNFALATAATPVIGVALKAGSFTMEGNRVEGNSTVLEGDRIDTGSGPARLELVNGNRLRLSAGAMATVYTDRLLLERGSGEVSALTPFRMESMNLQVSTMAPKGSARLAVQSSGLLHVDAVQGEVQVSTKSGILLARLEAGTSLDFTPPADQAVAPSKLTGVIRRVGGKFVLQDETSKLTFELRGENLESLVGQRVELEGIALNSGSSAPAVQVVKTTRLDKSTVLSQHHHVPTAVIAGVGVAAAAASAGFVVSNNGDTKSVSPSSR